MRKKIIAMILGLVLIFGETISANADGLYTSGGKSNKYWSMSIGKTSQHVHYSHPDMGLFSS